ncbi:MAG: hypothetical protein RR330_03045 [Alistipes sp.]
MNRDTDFNPQTEEELLEQQRNAEVSRCVRREVIRIQNGEAEEDLRADREQEQLQKEEQEKAEEKARRRESSPFWGLVTGNVLGREWLSSHYLYPLLIAGGFFISIFIMFWALRFDIRYTRTEHEVQLLRERSIRLEEQLYRRTTHSAIVEQLTERAIPLYDPLAPGEQIDN